MKEEPKAQSIPASPFKLDESILSLESVFEAHQPISGKIRFTQLLGATGKHYFEYPPSLKETPHYESD